MSNIQWGTNPKVLTSGNPVVEQAPQSYAITANPKLLQAGSYVIPAGAEPIIFGGALDDLQTVSPDTNPLWYLSTDSDIFTLSRPAYVQASSDTGSLTLYTPTVGGGNQWNRVHAEVSADGSGARTVSIPPYIRKVSAWILVGGVPQFVTYDPAPSKILFTGLGASSFIILTGHFQW